MSFPSSRVFGAVTLAVLAIATIAAGCGARDSGLFGRGTSSGQGGSVGEGGGGAPPVEPPPLERVDLLLVVDNSGTMGDKHPLFARAAQDFVEALIAPPCQSDDGSYVAASDGGDCPNGSTRLFEPVKDLHIGVITTSLGGHGSDTCLTERTDDRAHLVSYAAGGGNVPTYADLGFLAWDPNGTKSPPGESELEGLRSSLGSIVMGVGQTGCGFESAHESWYRFLIEPDPHDSIDSASGDAVLIGTDEALLTQRREFLRPDSLLVIVTLTDENDCSVRDGSQYFFALQRFKPGTTNPYHLPRARAACATDPNSACCRSCGQEPGPGCDDSLDQCASATPPADDHINVRCWDQKRRFGIDFLQPIARYRDGLTNAKVADRAGNVVPNPLFAAADDFSTPRGPEHIRHVSLVGVPWQDIARQNAQGQPDLDLGLDALGRKVGGFRSAAELAAKGVYDLVLGDPSEYHTSPDALPTDPLMLESITPRSGTHPITGEPLAPAGSPISANSINGHERDIADKGSLQYACIFPLDMPKDCTGLNDCQCAQSNNTDPLCQADDGSYGTIQYRAAAYPGIRHLELARSLDDRGLVGSICPAPEHGFEPLVRPLLEAVAPHLD